MITRSKLVEQLREHQIRSAQSYSAALAVFSPNPHIASRRDLKVALLYAVLFCFLMVSCYVALYLKWFTLSSIVVFLGILLPACLLCAFAGGCNHVNIWSIMASLRIEISFLFTVLRPQCVKSQS